MGNCDKDIRSKMNSGWLDRDGCFYDCDWESHDEASLLIQGSLKLQYSLEYLGWLRIQDDRTARFGGDFFRPGLKISIAQMRWISREGVIILGVTDLPWKGSCLP